MIHLTTGNRYSNPFLAFERLEQIFIDYKSGSYNSEYVALDELPDQAAENVLNCKNDLLEEGKNVAYIL